MRCIETNGLNGGTYNLDKINNNMRCIETQEAETKRIAAENDK